MSLRLHSLLGFAALLFLVSSAQAQVIRPSNTLYLGLRGGATAYGGDIDGTTGEGDYGWLFSDLGWGAGGELGYQFTRSLGFSLGGLYTTHPQLDDNINSPNIPGNEQIPINDETRVLQIQGLFRYLPFSSAPLSPYVLLGGSAVYGQGRDVNDDVIMGWGPTVGFGIDWLFARQLSFFLEGQTSFVFPDDAVDNLNPSASTLVEWSDDADFDNVNFYGGGLRFYFRPGGIEVSATIDCATDLNVGETGTFTAYANDDATQPVEYMWDFGDGSTGMGMTASHAYAAEGTYTVTLMAEGPVNTDTETCLVTVTRVPAPPVLANCRVSSTSVGAGQEVTVSATLTGDPATVTVDFGDGTTANALPATHSYAEPGSYQVRITATNADGTDTCDASVRVGDTFCDEVTELNTVYFDFDSSALTDDGRARLDENLEVLRRCPNVCVVINGYTDDVEEDKLRLSQRRADEVRAYYVANGIGEERLRARGLGEAPDANNKEDPGPGDRNARRAESIPVDCARLDSMGGM